MPTLKHLVCNVQWAETGAPFPEYGTQYGDGFVETFIAIPNHPQLFSIRLASRRFIHEGLAMLVFIDGKYQCNRVRVNLQSPQKALSENRSKVDFVVRQKETRLGEGAYMGREWRFDDYNIVPKLPPGASESHFEELGTIEVFVLRCNSNDPDEFDALSESSKEDSVIMEQDDGNAKRSGDQPTEAVAEPDLEHFPFAGIFDGPSDRPSSSHFLQVDGPADDHPHWDHRYRQGHPPYPPQEGPPYHPRPYQQGRVPEGAFYYRRPTPPTPPPQPRGERDPSDHLPPRNERRVHFDYGTAREGPMYSGLHQSQRMPQYHGNYYYQPQHYMGHHPYGDYPSRHAERHYAHRHAEPRDYRDYPQPPMAHGALGVPPPASSSRIPGLSERSRTLPNHTRMGSVPQVQPHPPAPAPLPYTAVQQIPGPHPLPMPTWFGPPHPVFPPSAPGPAPIFPYLPSNNIPWFQAPNQSGPQNAQSATTSADTGTSNDAAKQNPGSTATTTNAKGESSNTAPKDSNNNATNNTCANSDTQHQTWSDNNANKPEQDQSWNPSSSDDKGTSNNNDDKDWNYVGSNDNNSNNNTGDTSNQGWSTSNNDGSGNQNNIDKSWEQYYNTNDDNKSNKSSQYSSQDHNTTSNPQNVPASTSNTSGKMTWYGPYGPYQAAKFHRDASVPAIAEEEPRYDVPQAVAQAKGVTKQVQPGRGYIYNKKSVRPAKYLDTVQDPYARFIFKYRPKEQIKTETGIDVSSDPTPDTDRNALEGKSKDELIELVLRAKGALGGNIPDQPPPKSVAPVVSAPLDQVPIAAPQHAFSTYYLPAFRRPSVEASSSGAKPSDPAATDQGWGSGTASGAAAAQQTNNSNSWQEGGEATGWKDREASNTGNWDGQNEEEPVQSYPPNKAAPSNSNIPAPSDISPLTLPGPAYPTNVPTQPRVWQDPIQSAAAAAAPPPLNTSTSVSSGVVRSVPLTDPFGPCDATERRAEPVPYEMAMTGFDDPVPRGFSCWDRYFMHPNSPDIPGEYVREPIIDHPGRPRTADLLPPPPVSGPPAPGQQHEFWL